MRTVRDLQQGIRDKTGVGYRSIDDLNQLQQLQGLREGPRQFFRGHDDHKIPKSHPVHPQREEGLPQQVGRTQALRKQPTSRDPKQHQNLGEDHQFE